FRLRSPGVFHNLPQLHLVTNNLYGDSQTCQVGTMHPQFSRNFSSTFGFAVSNRAKSLVRNILPASPYSLIFYRDAVISTAPNSNEAKILARHDQKIIDIE